MSSLESPGLPKDALCDLMDSCVGDPTFSDCEQELFQFPEPELTAADGANGGDPMHRWMFSDPMDLMKPIGTEGSSNETTKPTEVTERKKVCCVHFWKRSFDLP